MEKSYTASSFSISQMVGDDKSKNKAENVGERRSFTIGVYPGTFRTFIDLRDEDEDEPKSSSAFEKEEEPTLETFPKDGDVRIVSEAKLGIPIEKEGFVQGAGAEVDGEAEELPEAESSANYELGLSELKSISNASNSPNEYIEETGNTADSKSSDELQTTFCRPQGDSRRAKSEDLFRKGSYQSAFSNADSKTHIGQFSQHSFCVSSSSSCTQSIEIGSSSKKQPRNKLTCEERKAIMVSDDRPLKVTYAMKQWIVNTTNLLDRHRNAEDCWFHPSPPAARRSRSGVPQSYGKIQKRFTWQDETKHSMVLNYGIVWKLINHKMTEQQKDGFIKDQWHLSHLCGNWTCLNPEHTTVESGEVNISRNLCFSHRSGCCHDPPCMKEKKVALGADGKLLYAAAVTSVMEGVQMSESHSREESPMEVFEKEDYDEEEELEDDENYEYEIFKS